MLGPYTALKDGRIKYKGNKVFDPIPDVTRGAYTIEEAERRISDIHEQGYWQAISVINNQIYISCIEYFSNLGALYTQLPLTTRMISSPGAVYGKEAIDYTSDTLPVTLDWFDLSTFLAESAQIYLELTLIQRDINHVYSIYNSFRKEETDATHLSEFHHIEYEGVVNQEENKQIIMDLCFKIVNDLVKFTSEELGVFLDEKKIKKLEEFSVKKQVYDIDLVEALETLYRDTGDEKYREFTTEYFGSWEEVRLTEIYGGMVAVNKYPLLEVPFYHEHIKGSHPPVANCADYLWPGYIETIGSGQRIKNISELEEKAEIFNLPREDYECYLQSRRLESYRATSGFGMGWERLLQGILETPYIWSAVHFPRSHITMTP